MANSERKVLDTVLMEFDGVIADTATARRDALCTVLAEEGIVLSDDEYRGACVGLATEGAVRAAVALRETSFDDTAVDLLVLRADRAFSAWVSKGVMLVAGVRETIERLAARARLGIVSRASRRDIELVLSLARIEHAFSCVVGIDDAHPAKPSPAPYQHALRRLERTRRIAPDGVAVAIEDGLPGIRAASAAGLRCIAVGDLPAHIAMEADALIPSITGLDADRIGHLILRTGETFA